MTMRRVLGAGTAVLGVLALVTALVGVFRSELALAPVGVLGLVLLGAGLAAVQPASASVPRLVGGHRLERATSGPTAILDFGADPGSHGESPGRPGADADRPGGGSPAGADGPGD